MQISLASTTAPALPGHAVAGPDPHAAWKPVPELVGRRGVPWVDKTLIRTTAEAAAEGVLARYDSNGDGAIDRRTESTHEDIAMYWANADGSRFSGYTQPEHLATLRTVTSIDALLAAASPAGSTGPVRAAAIAAVFAGFDTNHDGRLTWDDAGGGNQYSEFYDGLVQEVGERTDVAERIVSGA
jgi:hypothetical protein